MVRHVANDGQAYLRALGIPVPKADRLPKHSRMHKLSEPVLGQFIKRIFNFGESDKQIKKTDRKFDRSPSSPTSAPRFESFGINGENNMKIYFVNNEEMHEV